MGAPNVTFTADKQRLSAVSGFDVIRVTFAADAAYTKFECRATRHGEAWGVGVGELVASFSATPANTTRTFEIYDDYLLHGDGEYRIGLYVQAEDGSWNDTIPFIPDEASGLITADGFTFLCRKGDS